MTSADWRSPDLGPAQTLDLGDGRRIRAHVTGAGPADRVRPRRAREREPVAQGRAAARRLPRVALDLPLGSHLEPMPQDADLTPAGAGRSDRRRDRGARPDDVTLVGNDTGGALCQIVATRRPERIGALVLTSCDAFDNFPPPFFRDRAAPARIPGVIPVAFGACGCARCAGCRSPSAGSPTSRSTATPRTPTCCRC